VVVQRVGCKRRFVFGAVVELSGQPWPARHPERWPERR
jgi:hypothetical protein